MKPCIITLTGPSCAGKSTLEHMLACRGLAKAVSTTTRPIREGEVEGSSYYYVSRDEFTRQLNEGRMVESVEFGGNCYGLSVEEVERLAQHGRPIVVVCEPVGQKQIVAFSKKQGWDCLSVFIDSPLQTIATRFLERFANDVAFETGAVTKIKIATYARRLREMMLTEQWWVEEARTTSTYDLVIKEFDTENQQWVIDQILFLAGKKFYLKEAA